MLQLFQPTNITPDTRGSFGNGVVLIDIPGMSADNITVSWQVNGNTPMTAFKIDFTEMDGTSLYTTGKLTSGCPFYGTAADGSVNLFSYKIGPLNIATSFLRSASEGLITITEWWGNGANDYVVQQSPSPYLVRPALVSSYSPNTITSRIGTFTGQFTGAGTDGIMWIRWVLKKLDTGQVLKDTGKLYGCVNPVFTYDAFLPGGYELELTAETSAGVKSTEAAYSTVLVEYDMYDSGAEVIASKSCHGENAVEVKWAKPSNIPATIGNDGFVIDNGTGEIYFSDDSGITWSTVNGTTMSFTAPWSFVWNGELLDDTEGTLFELEMADNGKIQAVISNWTDVQAKAVSVYYINGLNIELLASRVDKNIMGPFFCCITPTHGYIQYEAAAGVYGLYPEDDLYPSNSLYPSEERIGAKTVFFDFAIEPENYGSTTIHSVKSFGLASVRFIKIVNFKATYGDNLNLSCTDDYSHYLMNITDVYDTNTLFLLKSKQNQDYNAGNANYTSNMTGIELYRKSGDDSILTKVGAINNPNIVGMIDYGAKSQQGPFTYYMYPVTSTVFESTPAISNSVNPCFENWSVISCTKDTSGQYIVQKTFLFGLNLSSGSVSNNNRPNVLNNFSRYPTIQTATQNYKSGTLKSLIGWIDHTDGQEQYQDSVDLREAIWDLSTTTNYLFMKDRKGSLYMIRPSAEITMDTMDNTRQQAQTVSFPWVEVGDASEAQIFKPLY